MLLDAFGTVVLVEELLVALLVVDYIRRRLVFAFDVVFFEVDFWSHFFIFGLLFSSVPQPSCDSLQAFVSFLVSLVPMCDFDIALRMNELLTQTSAGYLDVIFEKPWKCVVLFHRCCTWRQGLTHYT